LDPLPQLRMHVLQAGKAAIVLPTMIPLPAEMAQDTAFVYVPVAALADSNAPLHRYVVLEPLLLGVLERFLDVCPVAPHEQSEGL